MASNERHTRQNYKTTVTLFLVAGVLLLVAGLITDTQPFKRMFLLMGLGLLISSLVQIVLYRSKKTLFKDKSSNPG